MTYPYDGIRSMASEYREMLDYIKTLKQENEQLKKENEELKEQLNEKSLIKRRNNNELHGTTN